MTNTSPIATASVSFLQSVNQSHRQIIDKDTRRGRLIDRKDTPWTRMTDEELASAVGSANGRVIIGFKDRGSTEGVDNAGRVLASRGSAEAGKAVVKSLGGSITYEFRRSPAVVAVITPSITALLRHNPVVDYLEPSASGTWHSQVTPWNITQVGAPAAWSYSTGSGVKLLVLDSGAPISPPNGHRDLYIPVAWRCISGPVSDTTLYGHGTHVAGIAAALSNSDDVIGVSHGATLWMANVAVNDAPDGAEVACSIDVARENGVFVVNMSFGITPSTCVTDQINGGFSEGMLFVASDGNTNVSSSVTYPATLTNVIAVTAVDSLNAHASFAPTGSEVDISAPGVNILSTALQYATQCTGGGSYTGICSGTSMAAPHVSGAAALLKARYPGWSNTQIRDRLLATTTDLGTSGLDNTYGYGLLNVASAIGMTTQVSGMSIAWYGVEQSWSAVVSGGQSPFSYQWYTNGSTAGTASSQSYTPGFSDFWMKVQVTDNNGLVAKDSLFVTVLFCTPPEISC